MSQVPRTDEEREDALRRFGYTERESRFLCLAGLHSGYFLRRQYDQFLGQSDGGAATQLIERALAKGHARAFTFRPRTHIYHLCSRPFYEALGQGDNRNRRLRQPLTIKNKLMGLDFVLAHAGTYFATEQEKLDYFAGRLHLPTSMLPTKHYSSAHSKAQTVRYFVDKYPIFLPRPSVSDRACGMSFSFVDEGLTTLSRFETYLAQYRQLFAALPQFTLVYVAATPAHFDGALRAFTRFASPGDGRTNGSAMDPDIRRKLDYFAARHRYETKRLDGFDREKLLQLRSDRELFSGARDEDLYARWKIEGDQGIVELLAPASTPRATIRGDFSTYLLEQNYELFGTLAM